MAGKGQPVGGAVTVLPACSQPRSGPACWNPACSECSKHLVGFCVKCCHCCSFVPWLSSLNSHLSEPRPEGRHPASSAHGVVWGWGVPWWPQAGRPGPSRPRGAPSQVTRSQLPDRPTSPHCSAFLRIDSPTLCNEKTLDGLTARPNMTREI